MGIETTIVLFGTLGLLLHLLCLAKQTLELKRQIYKARLRIKHQQKRRRQILNQIRKQLFKPQSKVEIEFFIFTPNQTNDDNRSQQKTP